jgi:hypothetical protein
VGERGKICQHIKERRTRESMKGCEHGRVSVNKRAWAHLRMPLLVAFVDFDNLCGFAVILKLLQYKYGLKI